MFCSALNVSVKQSCRFDKQYFLIWWSCCTTSSSLLELTGIYSRMKPCIYSINLGMLEVKIYQDRKRDNDERMYQWIVIAWCMAWDGDIPVYWYQCDMTPDTGHEAPWHCRGGLHYSSCFISSWRHAPPLCSPPPLIQFPSHLAWRGGSVSQNIEVSPVFYSAKTNESRWHVIHVMPPWPSHESWHTGDLESLSSDEMSQWHRGPGNL